MCRGRVQKQRELVEAAAHGPRTALSNSTAIEGGGGACAEGVGTFWHVTDWHVNEYEPPLPNPCDMCRSPLAGTTCTKKAGVFGHPDCDPSRAGWQEALEMMRKVQPAPDFILAGGDWVGHIPESRQGSHAVLSAAVLLVKMLTAAFREAPALHTVGNHDTWPYYSLAPAFASWDRSFERTNGVEYMQRQFPGAFPSL